MIVELTCIAGQNLESVIVSVLLGIEEAPSLPEGRWYSCPDEAGDGRIAIGVVPTGDFVVAVIEGERNDSVHRSGGVATLRKNTHRLIGGIAVVEPDVDQVCGVQRLALPMK